MLPIELLEHLRAKQEQVDGHSVCHQLGDLEEGLVVDPTRSVAG